MTVLTAARAALVQLSVAQPTQSTLKGSGLQHQAGAGPPRCRGPAAPWLACPYGRGGTQCKVLLSRRMASRSAIATPKFEGGGVAPAVAMPPQAHPGGPLTQFIISTIHIALIWGDSKFSAEGRHLGGVPVASLGGPASPEALLHTLAKEYCCKEVAQMPLFQCIQASKGTTPDHQQGWSGICTPQTPIGANDIWPLRGRFDENLGRVFSVWEVWG